MKQLTSAVSPESNLSVNTSLVEHRDTQRYTEVHSGTMVDTQCKSVSVSALCYLVVSEQCWPGWMTPGTTCGPSWAGLGLQDLLLSAGQISMSEGENVGQIVG